MTDDIAKPNATSPLDNGSFRYEDYERQTVASIPINKSVVLPALSAAGVSIVVVSFDGYGDSGQIEGVEARAGDLVLDIPDLTVEIAHPDWNSAELQRLTVSLRDAVEAVAWDILSSTHGGWDINDGAYGEVVFDVKAGEIRLDYNERCTDSEFFQHTF